MSQPTDPVDPKLVEKLTTLLEQARRGELTGFVAVSFRDGGGVDQWGWLTRREDIRRAPAQIEALHRMMTVAAPAPPDPAA